MQLTEMQHDFALNGSPKYFFVFTTAGTHLVIDTLFTGSNHSQALLKIHRNGFVHMRPRMLEGSVHSNHHTFHIHIRPWTATIVAMMNTVVQHVNCCSPGPILVR